MSAKSDLKHSIMQTVKHNKDGSFETQANRKERLLLMANQLSEGGYKIRHIKQLKYKHVKYLVDRWLAEQLNAGTMKNRMTDLRWVLDKFGKAAEIPRSNAAFGIPKRQYVTNQDKSITVSENDLSKITDENVKMSLILQRAFGLRRKESIKIRINEAVLGDELRLKGEWCKNGRPRTIKIQYPEQWQAIEQVKAFVGSSHRALIPENKQYVQQKDAYNNQLNQAGIRKAHGLRHAFAQKRYFDLVGISCPAKGGLTKRELNPEQLTLDHQARSIISEELGHSRLDVVSIYIGH